jgi:hypothetical protein
VPSSGETLRLRGELAALELRLAKSEARVQEVVARVTDWESTSRYGRQRVVFVGLLLFAGVFITYLIVRKLLT